PELASSEEDADEMFLVEAEESVDAFCTHNEECEDWWNSRGLLVAYFFDVFETTPACYEPLRNSIERIHGGDRCTDPDTMLALLDCVAAIPCPSYQEYRHRDENGTELCAEERTAMEDARCNPFFTVRASADLQPRQRPDVELEHRARRVV